jgi:multidrug efflux pump subunit AcrB
MSITRYSVRNPVAVNILMWAVLAGGIVSAFSLRKDLFPTMDPEEVFVSVAYPGATPEEVERLVARRIERAVEGTEEVDEVLSEVFEGLVVTRITMVERADRDRVLSDVRNAIDEIREELPEGAEEPDIRQVRPIFPVISVVVFGEVNEGRLREAARRVRDDLLDLTGSSEVTISGIRDREIWVEILPERLEEHGLTFEEVGRVLAGSNMDLPAGQLKAASGNIRVRTLGEKSRAAEIAALAIESRPDGSTLRLSDLADVRETFADVVSRGRFRGLPAAMVTVFKTPEQDAVEMALQVKEYAEHNPAPFGDALRLESTRDLSRFISQRLDLMVRNAHLGLFLVVCVLAVFLELRVAFWVAVGLAVSFLGTFLVMELVGVTINLISMFGLIVVLGLLVDDAIVVAENVFTKKRAGLRPDDAAIEGTNEVAAPVVVAILTTMVAFSPLAFLEGRMGAFLGVLPVVVVAALAVSLFEAFVVLPSHLTHAERTPGGGRLARFARRVGALRQDLLEHRLRAAFAVFAAGALRWRYVTLAVVVTLMLVSTGMVAGDQISFRLMGDVDAETALVDLEMAPGTSEERTDEVLRDLETLIEDYPEVDSCFTMLGSAFRDGQQVNVADPATVGQITIEMVAADRRGRLGQRRTDAVLDDLRRATLDIPGVRQLVLAPMGGGPQGSDIEVRLRGEELDRVREATDYVREVVGGFDGVTEVYDDLVAGKYELRFSLRDEARTLGLTTRDLAGPVRHALFGFEVQDLQDEDEEVTVRVLLPERARSRIQDLGHLRIPTPSGRRVPLEEVARFETARGYSTLNRVDGKRAITVRAQVDEERANVGKITDELQERLTGLGERFAGVSYSFEGQKEQARESLGSLRIGFGVAILLIYALVAVLFRSYVLPLLVMAAIPISFLGVIMGHVVMGHDLTLLSLIGGVALAGIVVNDSLILIDLVNRKRRAGQSTRTAVLDGSRERLRAILLTSATTIAGLAPIMLETSFQAQFLIPMAISIVFGVAFATVLTLVVVPALYLVLDDVRVLLRRAWSGSSA